MGNSEKYKKVRRVLHAYVLQKSWTRKTIDLSLRKRSRKSVYCCPKPVFLVQTSSFRLQVNLLHAYLSDRDGANLMPQNRQVFPKDISKDLERRARTPYIGKPRYMDRQRKVCTWRPGSDLFHRPQRAFNAPSGAIVWTRNDQFRAIALGFALVRVHPTNRVYVQIVMVPHRHEMFPHWRDFRHDLDILAKLERVAFWRPGCWAWKALAFIEQQDKWGFSSTWEDTQIETVSSRLQWFNEMVREKTLPAGTYVKPRRHIVGRRQKKWKPDRNPLEESGSD